MKRMAICIALLLVTTALLSESDTGSLPSDGEPDDRSRCIASSIASHRAAANGETWSIEVVDARGKTGKHTDIVHGQEGTIYISYYDFLQGDLRCAHQSDETWQMDTVDAAGDVGTYTSIDVDSQGRPGISYYDETNQHLKYAVMENGGWMVETVDAADDVGRYASLAIDGQGVPHILYYDATNTDLKYATRSGDSWNIEVVASNGDVGKYAAIALDGAGEPYCTYGLDETTLMYAHLTRDGWVSSQVDSDLKLFESTAIVMEDDTPHISYFDTSDDPTYRLRYATVHDGTWNIEVVDPDIYGFWNERGLGMAVQNGVVHIGYFHWDDWDVGYAYKYGDRWTTEIVESHGDVGAFASIALDSQGYPHMSYMDRSTLALKYARKTEYAPVAPDKPDGPGRGKTGTEYTYITSTADLDGDDVQYGWDWDGDRTVDHWTELVSSGEENEVAHVWDSDGTYTIRVKARDSTGLESEWSNPLQVSMPHRRASLGEIIWQWLMGYAPFLFPLLSSLS